MADNALILKRTVTYTSEDASRGTGGIGYDIIPYPEPTIEPDANKESPTITLTPASITTTEILQELKKADYYDVSIAYNGDGMLYVDYCDIRYIDGTLVPAARIVNDKLRIFGNQLSNSAEYNEYGYIDYPVRSTTTATCNQASATFSVTYS